MQLNPRRQIRMIRYIPCGCCKCDFSEGQSTKLCKKGFCNSYEESYIKGETDAPIGYASLEEFNKKYGTNYR